jgi:hypothetical protein
VAARSFLSKTAQRPRLRELILLAGACLECVDGLLGECPRFLEIEKALMSLLLQCLCNDFPRLSKKGAWRMEQKKENDHSEIGSR